jgi:20S proteasome subunit beta 1
METGLEPLVKTAAHVAKSVVYNNKDRFTAGLIVAGWDKHSGGQVYVVPINGMLIRRGCHISGSGSIFPMGFIDANYRPNMTKEEAIQLATTCKISFLISHFVFFVSDYNI